jgi:hypothetical protein
VNTDPALPVLMTLTTRLATDIALARIRAYV